MDADRQAKFSRIPTTGRIVLGHVRQSDRLGFLFRHRGPVPDRLLGAGARRLRLEKAGSALRQVQIVRLRPGRLVTVAAVATHFRHLPHTAFSSFPQSKYSHAFAAIAVGSKVASRHGFLVLIIDTLSFFNNMRYISTTYLKFQ